MEEGPVRSQVEDGQALLTIDRPAARNALSPEVVEALRAALARAEADPSVRVVVLTGAGDRAFSAGGDLGSMSEGGFLAGHGLRRAYGGLLEALAASPLPTVARVNGHALGGGLGLVLACDLAVAVDSAELGTPEADVGLFPMMVLAWLQRHLGRKRALELLLTGDRLSAGEALRWGLLNRVVPRGELDAATHALAARVAGKSRAVLGLGKTAFRTAEGMSLPQAMDFLAGQLSLNLGMEDAAEGISAFLERRPPRWKDR
ncbi:MAG TPA: enoyl-CoA hydratase-related protein [Myxococcaceae bacterium]|nr:enoyl-CoA hydratase-related protein [Myxococcaceae bacterium]